MSTTVVPRTDTLSPAPQIAAAQGGSTAVCPPGEALVAATEIVREVAQAELDSVAKDELLSLLHGLDEAARLVEACRAKVLSAVDQREAWRGNGRDASMAAWRSRTTRTGQGKAHREVSTARTLTATPGATDALTAGHMTPEHAEALSRIATSGGVERRAKIAQALADPESSRELLDSAKHLDAPRFARAAQAWAARLDAMSLEVDHAAQRRARFLSVADTPAGTVLKGRLDAMAGHRLRLALEAVTPVPSADDPRDHGQRAADALDTLARGALADPTSKPGGHVPPHVSVIMTEETLAGLRALEDPQRDTEGPRFPPATLEDGTPVPASETVRILCDAQVTRIVVGADSMPMDLGRTKRLWTGAQRRLVIARDRHCAFPGCQIPARWCEIHHIAWWARDRGTTDIENAVLLCTSHHGAVHTNNLSLAREPAPPGPPGASLPLTRYTITDPTGRDWSIPPASPPPAGPPRPGAPPPCDSPGARISDGRGVRTPPSAAPPRPSQASSTPPSTAPPRSTPTSSTPRRRTAGPSRMPIDGPLF